MYYLGQGVDMNYKKASKWYKKAAKQGHAEAQYNLGAMHENGDGVDQSDSMAMRWYAKAAAQGHEEAQGRIAAILARRRASFAAAREGSAGGGGWVRPATLGSSRGAVPSASGPTAPRLDPIVDPGHGWAWQSDDDGSLFHAVFALAAFVALCAWFWAL